MHPAPRTPHHTPRSAHNHTHPPDFPLPHPLSNRPTRSSLPPPLRPPHTQKGAAIGAAPQAVTGTVHFVLGNEACDLDSLVSALVLAYALSTSTAAFPLRAALAPGAAGEYVAQ